jgi:hypothetical protein
LNLTPSIIAAIAGLGGGGRRSHNRCLLANSNRNRNKHYTGAALNAIDDKYQLTEKLIAALDQCAKEFAKKRDELEQTLGRTYHEAERELMWRGYGFDVDNPNIK